jgi:hypothetical protein
LLGIDTYFFCSRNTRNATIFFTERLRERESLPTYRKTELAAAVKKKEDVYQVRFVVGPFFVITSVFVEGEFFPESTSQCFNPGV